MLQHQVFFSRYQTSHASQLRKISKIMRESGIIHKYFVNRSNLTCVIVAQGDHPITVQETSDLLTPFEGTERANVLAICDQNYSDGTETESVVSLPTSGR